MWAFLRTGRKPDDSRGLFGMATAGGNSILESAGEKQGGGLLAALDEARMCVIFICTVCFFFSERKEMIGSWLKRKWVRRDIRYEVKGDCV